MKRITLVLLLIASTAGAATVIGWSINNAYGLKLLTAFEAQDDCFVQISFRGSENAADPNIPDYAASIGFRTPVRDPGDTDAQYVKRRVGLIIDAIVQAHQAKIKNDTLKAYNELAPSVDVNSPSVIGE